MRKTYITNMSQQFKKGDLKEYFYVPRGFEMRNNRNTHFPIIPVITDHQEKGDENKILVIRSKNKAATDNYQVFLGELGEIGIPREQVTVIFTEEDQSRDVSFKLLKRILEEIPEDSLVYGDITFGTKPMSAILLYAMSFIEKIKNCEVDGIYYGEIQRNEGEEDKSFMYDLTALNLLGDIIEQMKGLGVKNIQEALDKIIEL